MGTAELFALSVLIFLVFQWKRRGSLARDVAELIEAFHDNFRGGPPSPMHPLPADDRALLSRRKTAN